MASPSIVSDRKVAALRQAMGPVIAQARVPVQAGDTEELLAARVLAAEHRLYPESLAEAARTIRDNGGPTKLA